MNKHPNMDYKPWKFERTNSGAKTFTILTPPPNLTGSLHLGHALTFSVQDFFIRRQIFLHGLDAYLLPGFDHGGIASEYMAIKQAKERNIIFKNDEEKLQYISDFCDEAKPKIIKQMEKLHLCMDWTKERYTMDDQHKQLVEKTFIQLYESGIIYYGESIVNWDPILKTPLSDLEVNYKKQEDLLYTISYKIKNHEESINVATTRPETIFGDIALAVNPDDERYKHLIGMEVYIPIINKIIPIICDKRVKMDFGTGILKITPAHSLIDYEIAIDHFDKESFVKIIENNKIVGTNTEYDGMNVIEVREILGKRLAIFTEIIIHEVPYSFRSQAKIEHLLQKQWFCSLKKIKHKLTIIPEIWENSYNNWIENMHDWCISRSVTWGHKLPVYFKDNEYVVGKELEGYNRSDQVLDTWFSSALWPLVYEEYPSDLLVTAYDILFFWVVRMSLMCLNLHNTLPFKKVFIHRLVRDGEGRKMSKTTGNVLNPIELINVYGVDAVRYSLLRTVTTNGNINFSEKLIKDAGLFITKLWNLGRYIQLVENKNEDNLLNKNKDEISDYFQEKCNYVIELCGTTDDLHVYIDYVYDFLYEICDWLVEFSKVRKYLFYDLKQIFRKLLLLLNPILPCVTKELYEQLYNEDIFKDNLNNKDIKKDIINPKTPNIFQLICELRSWNSMCNILIIKSENYDLVYHMTKIKKKDDCEENNNITYNYIFSDTYLYFYNINSDMIKKKLENLELKLNMINIDILMPEEIINERKEYEKKLKEEIKKLQYLLCI